MTLDQRHHVTFPVSRAEIDRAATVQIYRSGKLCFMSNFRRPFLTVFLTEEIFHIGFHVTGIRNVHLTVSESDLHGFQLLMNGFRVFLLPKR